MSSGELSAKVQAGQAQKLGALPGSGGGGGRVVAGDGTSQQAFVNELCLREGSVRKFALTTSAAHASVEACMIEKLRGKPRRVVFWVLSIDFFFFF